MLTVTLDVQFPWWLQVTHLINLGFLGAPGPLGRGDLGLSPPAVLEERCGQDTTSWDVSGQTWLSLKIYAGRPGSTWTASRGTSARRQEDPAGRVLRHLQHRPSEAAPTTTHVTPHRQNICPR